MQGLESVAKLLRHYVTCLVRGIAAAGVRLFKCFQYAELMIAGVRIKNQKKTG